MKSFCLLLVVLVVGVVSATDYCSSSICNGGKHIACGHNNWWDKSCPSDAEMLKLTNEHKDLFVKMHNEKRNYIAGGNDPRHSAACRMATMQWDDELAYLAELNVRQCKMSHDSCHNTDAFKYSGQNLGWQGYSGNLPSMNTIIEKNVAMWYNEVANSHSGIIEDGYPSGYSGPTIGHFTVMMYEKNIRVGCASSRYTKDGWNSVLTACNYAYTNMIGSRIYSSCSRAAQGCTTGTDGQFRNLCSIRESYNVNGWN
ncbi:antigen 5 like allergen Cul n 1-like [Drosophila innubila]|uniref:antigen 5 like allergen Cul n 1-like n=1 Tax=Drosophila innubila TaxID=198719 RepID=UPI00148E6D8D|nr:antigen 5 like allergen Cul n 1-like [Drosophila innubila]